MPIIKSNTDLGNDYDSISNLCYTCGEPVFITKNGKGDLAVMSIEAYEEITTRFELYNGSPVKTTLEEIIVNTF